MIANYHRQVKHLELRAFQGLFSCNVMQKSFYREVKEGELLVRSEIFAHHFS